MNMLWWIVGIIALLAVIFGYFMAQHFGLTLGIASGAILFFVIIIVVAWCFFHDLRITG